MRLNQVLRSKPQRILTLPPDASVVEAATLMHEENVGAVVISSDRREVLGLLSERDLAVGVTAYGPAIFRMRAAELMAVGGPVAAPDDLVQDAMRIMTERRARHLPVLQDGALVGVVSIGDLLKSRLDEKSQENAVLQDMARAHLAA